MATTVNLGPLSRALKNGSKWADSYPAWQHFAGELEGLCEFVRDKGEWDNYMRALQGPDKQRNAALMELRVALHLERSGFPVLEWSPMGAGGNKGEFVVEGSAKERVFVEVKGPEWESEVPKDELKAGRSRQPKYIHLEGRSIPARYRSIRFAVDKAYQKLRDDTPNLLVVADNLFISLEYELEFEVSEALYSRSPSSPGYFTNQRYENLGAVAIFWLPANQSPVQYKMRLFLNPYSRKVTARPAYMQTELRGEIIDPLAPPPQREPGPLERYLANPSEWE